MLFLEKGGDFQNSGLLRGPHGFVILGFPEKFTHDFLEKSQSRSPTCRIHFYLSGWK